MQCEKCRVNFKGLDKDICFNCEAGLIVITKEKVVYNRDRKTKDGFLYHTFHSQKSSCKRREMEQPHYTLFELIEWCLSQKIYHRLFEEWVNSDFAHDYVPSINRLDESKTYMFDNIEILSWKDHRLKAKGSGHKAVIKYDLEGNELERFISITAASKGAKKRNAMQYISMVCRLGGGEFEGFRYSFV
jgi:hypothetical protein